MIISFRHASLKVTCRVKTNATWTTKNRRFSHYFTKKFEINTLQGQKRYIKIFESEINNIRIQILQQKFWNSKIQKFYLSRAPSPYRINFSVQFSVQYIHITRIFKRVSHFFLLLCAFWEMSKSVARRVAVQLYPKRMLDY